MNEPTPENKDNKCMNKTVDRQTTMKSDDFQLDDRYSTTRRVTTALPELVNKADDKVKSVLNLPENPERKAEGGLRVQGYFKKNDPNKPLISVVTVVFNGAEHLEQTIGSVIGQSYDNVEYIIIDGGSTDGTLDIIKRYEEQIDYWVSEPDGGISDAFNKGVSLCSGEIIGIINADDWYEGDTFYKILEYCDYDIIHGNLQYWKGEIKKELVIPNQDFLYREMTINHPTCFVKKNIYKKVGLFNNSFTLAMDYDFLLRALQYNATIFYIPVLLANMRLQGASDINWKKAYREVMVAKTNINGNKPSIYGYYYFQIIRKYVGEFAEKIGLEILVSLYRKRFSIMSKYYK